MTASSTSKDLARKATGITKVVTPIGKLDAETFYRLRDDRTNMLTQSRDYHTLRARVISDPQTAQSYTGQVQLLVACNLLARWCRHLELGFPDAPLMPLLRRTGHSRLHERVIAEVKAADPFGDFLFSAQRSKKIDYTLKIGGGVAAEAEQVSFSINSNGWVAQAGIGNKAWGLSSTSDNALGAAFAACVGVADAFKVATAMPAECRVREFAWSLFDFTRVVPEPQSQVPVVGGGPNMPDAVTLGIAQMVGVGSVGSAAVYLLAMLPVVGTLQLIDHDKVKIINLNRSPLFGIEDVDSRKAVCGADYLHGIIDTQSFSGPYHTLDQHGLQKPDLIMPLANELGVRSFIENSFPPIQVYGTTTRAWGINYHRHIPLKEDCSLCRFPENTRQLPMACSEVSIDMGEGEQIDAALPFLSMGAAILTVADLVKLQYPGYPFTPNFCMIDWEGNMDFFVKNEKRPRNQCLCSLRSTKIHQSRVEGTRFNLASRR